MQNKIRFESEPENGFYVTLRKRVSSHFKENNISQHANREAKLKALLFVSFFVTTYCAIVFYPTAYWFSLILWFLMGVSLMLSAMCIVHDAAHGTFSRKSWVNRLLLLFANLAGGDGYMYKYKHVVSHHPYTNIYGLDIDLEQSALVRVTPFSKNRNHRYQEIYMKFLYPFYILFWVLVRDFKYYSLKKIGLREARHPSFRWVILIASKIFYLFYMVVVPYWLLPFAFWQIVAGFISMHMGSGLVAMAALLSNHVVEDSHFVKPEGDGLIRCTWAEHQLRTTDDYSPDSRLITFLFSGLNHHVAHHLFPNFNHVHYPVITRIVRTTAHEFGLRYRFNSIWGGLKSHFRLLRTLR
jgi:linoleoyl-CoA desaturase